MIGTHAMKIGTVHTLLAAAALIAAVPASAQDRVVNVYNWAEHTAPDTLSGFEKTTGIKIRYDVYDTNDTLQAKLLTGKSGYDVVVPSTHYAARQIQGGLFQKLDRSKIPNWQYLDPDLMALVATVDPGNQGCAWAVPPPHCPPRRTRGGFSKKLTRPKTPNWKHRRPALGARVATVDPGNQ